MDGFSIIVPEGPLITVHKGWLPSRKQPLGGAPSKGESKVDTAKKVVQGKRKENGVVYARHFEFVNAIEPGRSKDPAVRKLVRTHVRNEYVRNAAKEKKSKTSKEDIIAESKLNATSRKRKQPTPRTLGNPTTLSTFAYPIAMEETSFSLLKNYITHAPKRLYPLESCLSSNPLRSPSWFQMAMGDEALLHGILYAGALYLALLDGKRESKETMYHFSKLVGIVNGRLSGGREVEDNTIGAVTCLAEWFKSIAGKPDLWQTHMLGIKQMITLRGNKGPLHPMVQAKIRRADVTGAIDYASAPLLEFERSDRDPIWTVLPQEKRDNLTLEIETLFTQYGTHDRLIPIISTMVLFTQAVHIASSAKHALDPSMFLEDLYFIEYQLLTFPTTLSRVGEESPLDKATRIASLLYLKAILQEFPHSTTGPSILLTQLQQSLSVIPLSSTYNSLLVWLALVGGSFSDGIWDFRRWFVSYLGGLKASMTLQSFDDDDGEVSRFVGLRSVFGKAFEALWVEVEKEEDLPLMDLLDLSAELPDEVDWLIE